MCGAIEWSIIYMKIFLIYLFLMNIAGFAAMGIAGMYAFRHKTKHWYFVKGMPLIFFIHVVIACVIYRNFY